MQSQINNIAGNDTICSNEKSNETATKPHMYM